MKVCFVLWADFLQINFQGRYNVIAQPMALLMEILAIIQSHYFLNISSYKGSLKSNSTTCRNTTSPKPNNANATINVGKTSKNMDAI